MVLSFVPSNVGVHPLATLYSIEHASSIAKRGVFGPKAAHALTFEKPREAAREFSLCIFCRNRRLAIARHIEQIAWRP